MTTTTNPTTTTTTTTSMTTAMPTITTTKTFSEWNNLGVTALENLDFGNATNYFRHAVREMRSYHVTSSSSASTSPSVSSSLPATTPNQVTYGDEVVEEPMDCSNCNSGSGNYNPNTDCCIIHPLPLSALSILQPPRSNDRRDDDPSGTTTLLLDRLLFANGGSGSTTLGQYSDFVDDQQPIRIYTHSIRLMEESSNTNGGGGRGDGMRVPLFSYDSVMEDKIRSAIVIFNLGLVYHLHGLCGGGHGSTTSTSRRTPSSVDEDLRKAKILYIQSRRLLADVMTMYHGQATGNILLDLLCMAVVNNLLAIHMNFMEYDDCRTLVVHLAKLAVTVRATSSTTWNYYNNLLVVLGTTTATATATATANHHYDDNNSDEEVLEDVEDYFATDEQQQQQQDTQQRRSSRHAASISPLPPPSPIISIGHYQHQQQVVQELLQVETDAFLQNAAVVEFMSVNAAPAA